MASVLFSWQSDSRSDRPVLSQQGSGYSILETALLFLSSALVIPKMEDNMVPQMGAGSLTQKLSWIIERLGWDAVVTWTQGTLALAAIQWRT